MRQPMREIDPRTIWMARWDTRLAWGIPQLLRVVRLDCEVTW